MNSWPRVGLISASTFLLITAAACGTNSSNAARPQQAVETAYTSTMNAKTAQFNLKVDLQASSTSGSKESTAITGSGAVDFSTSDFEMTVNAPTGGATKIIESNGILYVQVPPAAESQIPGGKPWASINLNEIDESKLGKSFSQLASADADSPAQALQDLGSVSNQVTRFGTSTIGGMVTTEYRAQVDLNKVASKVEAKDGQKAAQKIQNEEKALGTNSIPVEVWVDSTNLVRQFQARLPLPPASSGATNGKGQETLTMTLSDFGAAVDVTPPPSGEVADITSQVMSESS